MTTQFNGPRLLQAIVLNCLLLIAMPMAFAGLLTLINHATKRRLAQWWSYSQLVIGGLGTLLHELSHAVACIIFGHQIIDMQLLKLNLRDNPDHSLGHVNHSYQPGKLWPTIGNLWIGLAPIFGCSAAIWGLTWLLERPAFQTWLAFAEQPTWQLTAIWPLFSQLFTTTSTLLVIWLILCSMIAIGGFDLSSADYKGTIPGIIATVITISIGTGLISFAFPTANPAAWLITHLTPLMVVLAIAVILSSVSWLIIALCFALAHRIDHR